MPNTSFSNSTVPGGRLEAKRSVLLFIVTLVERARYGHSQACRERNRRLSLVDNRLDFALNLGENRLSITLFRLELFCYLVELGHLAVRWFWIGGEGCDWRDWLEVPGGIEGECDGNRSATQFLQDVTLAEAGQVPERVKLADN